MRCLLIVGEGSLWACVLPLPSTTSCCSTAAFGLELSPPTHSSDEAAGTARQEALTACAWGNT